ncbi:MAG TPA: glycosyltransferase family 1 protein [Sphingomicrobium sp.]|nr:glycosyltransferase family 1 protein [Sphingomicrobium sp.]
MQVTLCVDAIETQLTGIGRYTWELCRRLAERREISGLQFYSRRRLIDDPGRLLRGEPIYPGRLLRRIVRQMQAKRALRSTLVHGPNFFLPEGTRAGVITVHDLSVLRFPEMHPPARLQQFERRLSESIVRAAHVITDTETVRLEVIAEFSLDPRQVTAVPLGVDSSFQPKAQDELAPALRPWALSAGGYGLCVATLEPRKKIAELLRAWRDLPSGLRDAFPLVLAGGAGWRNEELLRQIAQGEDEGWLRYLGFVDERRLPHLYAGAALFAYPSIYEGFGLPPLEAMASGTPVMVSNRSCLPEVCGEAGGYFDPDDVEGMTKAIDKALTDRDWRQAARARGLEQARKFTWDRLVDATVAVYRAAWDAR